MRNYRRVAAMNGVGRSVLVEALMQEARCHARLGDTARALSCYDRLIRSAGRSQLSSDALMRSAVIYAGPLDDDAKAMECYSKVESEYPGTRNAEQAMYGRLALLMFAGKWDKAAELRKQFLKICKTERVRKSVDKVFGRMIACRSMKLKDEKRKDAYNQ